MKVYRKYFMMKIRQKISFMAFLKNETVPEFLLKGIMKSYTILKL